jgi:hypothetical protein
MNQAVSILFSCCCKFILSPAKGTLMQHQSIEHYCDTPINIGGKFGSLFGLTLPNFVPNFRFAQSPLRLETERCCTSLIIFITTTSSLYLYSGLSENLIGISISEKPGLCVGGFPQPGEVGRGPPLRKARAMFSKSSPPGRFREGFILF